MSTYEFLMAVAETIYAHIDAMDNGIADERWTSALDEYYEHLYNLAEQVIDWASMV